MTNEVIDYCANPTCAAEIYEGQACYKVGAELVCSRGCLVAKLRGKAVTVAGGGQAR